MIFLITFLLILSHTGNPGGLYVAAENENRPLRELIKNLENETGYRVLYRDALVAGIDTEFEVNPGWEETFSELLNRYGLDVKIDRERKQIVIYRSIDRDSSHPQSIHLKGYVIDAVTGERLPFTTVIWQDDGSKKSGTQTDLQGTFLIRGVTGTELNIRVSHVGYHPRELTFSSADISEIRELPVRLEPASFESAEIIIAGSAVPGVADTIYRGMLDIGAFSPVGESNTIRMLHTLPAVGFGTALAEGAFIRGSHPGAVQVLLDGSVIYNQSHLFGLVDSFNADAIRTSSFHYDITPARFQGPPGGTLSLVTKTGSLHDYGGNLGFSNSVIRGSAEGPIAKGRSSFLLSGRGSILNTIDWFNTGDMVAWGLDIDRKNSLDKSSQFSLGERLVRAGDYRVNFYDLHGKLFFEGNSDHRWMVSAYSGFNSTLQNAHRIVNTDVDRPLQRFGVQNFDTRNRWGNNAVNLSYYHSLSDHLTLETRSGISYYHTRFLKEDFIYQRPRQEQLLFIHEFENESELTHWHLAFDARYFDTVELGAALHGYRSAYLENSLNRPQFFQRTTPLLAELYADTEFRVTGLFEINAGGRVQYFSDGKYFKLSPRIRTTILPDSPVSFGFGYSRNHQYLYKLSFYNLTTSDIWIAATNEQKPSTVDQVTGGIYVRPWQNSLLQAEGYLKWQQNLRFHEMNIQSLNNPFEAAPWYFDNEGFSKGIELLFRQKIRSLQFTQTYTLGKTELKNRRLNDGEWYFADWDRRHQFNTMFSLQALHNLNIHLNWIYATGVPDRLDLFTSGDDRLGDYSRVDLSVKYAVHFNQQKLNVQAGIYNLLNRNNPWYRDWVYTIEERVLRDRFTPVQTDVYDLGFQPSFSVTYHF